MWKAEEGMMRHTHTHTHPSEQGTDGKDKKEPPAHKGRKRRRHQPERVDKMGQHPGVPKDRVKGDPTTQQEGERWKRMTGDSKGLGPTS